MSFYVKGIALRTSRDEKDYTNPDTGEVLPSHTTLIVDSQGYTKMLSSNFEPVINANQEYIFPVLIFPYVDKKDNTKAKTFMKIRSDEDIKPVVS